MSHKQNNSHPHHGRRPAAAGAQPGRLRAHLSFANVAAGLALFIALGGTATAAVTLDRDSVGAPQIRQDAVRSPEIVADAVRSPEIVSGAVRSSELRDGGVNVADISTGAQTALRGAVRFAEDDNDAGDPVPDCSTTELPECPDLLVLELASGSGSAPGAGVTPGAGARIAPQNPATPIPGSPVTEPDRNWLVQAKLEVTINNGPQFQGATCALFNRLATGPALALDEAAILAQPDESLIEDIALSAVVKKRAGNPTLALRCTSPDGNEVIATQLKITALEVGTVTSP